MSGQSITPPATGEATDKQQANTSMKAIKLDKKTRLILLMALPETAKQARRLIGALAFNPDSPTNRLNKGSGVNLSDVARKYIKYLRPYGYFVKCRIPPSPILNAFNEKSGQQLWGIYKLKDTEKRFMVVNDEL